MRKLFKYGGIIASIALIVAGAVSIGAGALGVMQVRDALSAEKIVGSPDMTPTLISAEAKDAGLNVATLDIPSQAVAGRTIDTGSEAQAFAGYMRIHALEASGGQVYAEMGRFLDKNGKATNDEALAAKDSTGQPVPNQARNLWVTETALTTALNTSFFAERVGVFTLAIGGALLLTGIGFLVLTLGGRFARTRPRLRPQVSQSRECSQRRPSSQSRTAEARLRPGLCRMGVRAELAVSISLSATGRAHGRIGSRLQCG